MTERLLLARTCRIQKRIDRGTFAVIQRGGPTSQKRKQKIFKYKTFGDLQPNQIERKRKTQQKGVDPNQRNR